MIKLKDILNENTSPEAAMLHAMVGSGINAAQDFIDEYNIDGKKLVDYVKQNIRTNPAVKYNVRDYIIGAKGTVGGDTKLRSKFIKQFQA
jgi:hypothetical protein